LTSCHHCSNHFSHSYAFYNGYLSELYKRQKVLEAKLRLLLEVPIPSPSSPLPTALATSYFDATDLSQLSRRKRPSTTPSLAEVDEDVNAVAAAIESDSPLSQAHLRSLRKLISWEIDALTSELKGTCKVTQNYYPSNLTVCDWFLYVPLPTLIYELEYPRQDRIDWSYVAEKAAATFGVIFVMIVVSTAYIYPVVTSILSMKEQGVELKERLKEFPWAFLDLLFPMMMEYLLSWYVGEVQPLLQAFLTYK
jgi:sterol O-acyltransferase